MRRLETTVDLLDALQERYGWTSDNQIAMGLTIPQGTVSNWRRGRTFPTEVHALTIGKALQVSPLIVMAIAAADRTQTDQVAHSEWSKIAKQLARGGTAALAALLIGTTGYTPPAKADDASVGIMSNKRRRRLSQPQAA